jgi:hypothetical protein
MSGPHLRERTKKREFVFGDEGRAGATAHFHPNIVVDKVEFAQVGIAYQLARTAARSLRRYGGSALRSRPNQKPASGSIGHSEIGGHGRALAAPDQRCWPPT